jgi:hypothetical protein
LRRRIVLFGTCPRNRKITWGKQPQFPDKALWPLKGQRPPKRERPQKRSINRIGGIKGNIKEAISLQRRSTKRIPESAKSARKKQEGEVGTAETTQPTKLEENWQRHTKDRLTQGKHTIAVVPLDNISAVAPASNWTLARQCSLSKQKSVNAVIRKFTYVHSCKI